MSNARAGNIPNRRRDRSHEASWMTYDTAHTDGRGDLAANEHVGSGEGARRKQRLTGLLSTEAARVSRKTVRALDAHNRVDVYPLVSISRAGRRSSERAAQEGRGNLP